jgi:cytochrome c
MNFLDKLILPESFATLNLLSSLLLLGRIFFLAYSAVIFAGTVLSVLNINNRTKSHSKNNLASEFINLGASNNLIPIGFGIVPFLSIVLIVAQMLHQTQTFIIQYLIISFAFYVTSLIFLYAYRMIINKNTNYTSVYNPTESIESSSNNSQIGVFPIIIGWISAILMFVALVMFTAVFSGLEDSITWDAKKSLIELFLSFNAIIHILKYLFFALSFTAIFMIYKMKLNQRNENSAYIYNQSIALKGWIAFLILTFINIFSFPAKSLTISIVNLTLLTAFIMIVQIQFIIDNAVRFDYKRSGYVFFFALILFSMINIIDHSTFARASNNQINILSENYEKIEAEFNKTLNVGAKADGKELYTTKCMSCHRFDQRLVGPPHKLILQKYANNKEAMIQFILKPVKVDPTYPDMPQQGLTPSEVKAVVEYMLKEYGDKLK